jgi:predicted transcriptional regulator
MARKRAESREGMVLLTVALSPEMHRALAILSLDRRESMNSIIRAAVAKELALAASRAKRSA